MNEAPSLPIMSVVMSTGKSSLLSTYEILRHEFGARTYSIDVDLVEDFKIFVEISFDFGQRDAVSYLGVICALFIVH